MEITPDIITQFGLIQKVSTGHAYLDMILVMLLPMILRHIFPVISEWVSAMMKWERATTDTVYERAIEHKKNYDYYWYDNDGPSNTILQKAVINYINTKTDILRHLPNADFQIKKKVVEAKPNMTGEDDDASDTETNEHTYDVNVIPPLGTWIDLKNGIEFMRNEEETDDKGKRTKKTYFLKATEKSGKKYGPAQKKERDEAAVKLIEDFIDEALELYRKQQSTKGTDLSRYLYIPVLSGFAAMMANKDEEGGSSASAVYKRYKLSEEKTFASFFHPDKDSILQLCEQFLDKKGKFGIAGYPQKLGFLLYGPPGTGKTSFIKALAQHTKRSVMSIPLTKIRTNQELMDIMFDQKIKVEGEDSISLPYNKTIFVMEDVDAASDVVHRRTEGSSAPPTISLDLLKKMQEATVKKEKKEKKDAEIQADSDDDDKVKSKGKAFGPMPAFGKSLFGGDDDLNLAGLLNVLDGVVDTPNRIVIMTTNHPEKLDPALIRPGRINKKIYMGRICVEQALQMMNHYFGTVPETTKAQLRAVFVDEALSPAELETMCADFDTVEQLADQLVQRFSFAAAVVAAADPSASLI